MVGSSCGGFNFKFLAQLGNCVCRRRLGTQGVVNVQRWSLGQLSMVVLRCRQYFVFTHFDIEILFEINQHFLTQINETSGLALRSHDANIQ